MTLRLHTIAAIVVLIGAAAWVATGKFSAVGSEADRPPSAQAAMQPAVGSISAPGDSTLRTVAVVQPAFVDHRRTIRVSGVTSPDKRATLAARTTGTLSRLAVTEGERVAKGEIVMTQAGRDRAARVATARAVLAQRQREFDAVSRLVSSGSSATLDRDTARSALATARSELEQAKIERDLLELRAPFAGEIDRVDVDEGDYLQEGAAVALLFAPTLGVLVARRPMLEARHHDGPYLWVARRAVRHPFATTILTLAVLIAVPLAYGKYGRGVEFFPNVEPDYGLLYVHARGNLSLDEQDQLVGEAERRLLGWPGIKTVYTRVGRVDAAAGGAAQDVAEDVVGTIQYEFIDWRLRKSANEILDELRPAMQGIPGAEVEVSVPDAGPPTGKAIQLRLSAADPAGLDDAARAVAHAIATVPDVIDVADGLPPPGIDWSLRVDRAGAARSGVSPVSIGTVVQLVTDGLKLSEYRPAGVDDAVDIRLRLPEERRTLSTLDELRVESASGPVPISNFVAREAVASTGNLTRIDGARTITVEAGIREGVQADAVRNVVKASLAKLELEDRGIRWKMVGADEEQAAASAFLSKAFGAAVFLIFVVLLAQFNRFTSVALVLSSVVMSTIGVLLGLLIMGQPFGIVMSGIGVIALAGVVVNNNIVLIDTYDHLRREGIDKFDAIIRTCRERARPVVLTAATAILGVLPIAFGVNLELLNHETTFGAPSTQWWIGLSSAIVFGLAFSTLLTLIVTPSLLMIVTRSNQSRNKARVSWTSRWFRRHARTHRSDIGASST